MKSNSYDPSFIFEYEGVRFRAFRDSEMCVDISQLDLSSSDVLSKCEFIRDLRRSIHAYLDLCWYIEEMERSPYDYETKDWSLTDRHSVLARFSDIDAAQKHFADLKSLAVEQSIIPLMEGLDQKVDALISLTRDVLHQKRIELAQQFPNEHRGYVYLFKLSTGHYKIGLSKNPQRRKREIVSGLPFTIELIHQIPCNQMACLEHELHEKYWRHRHEQTEWFLLEQSHVDQICAIKECNYEWVNNPEWDIWLKPPPRLAPLMFASKPSE